jgi:hypothetical protein
MVSRLSQRQVLKDVAMDCEITFARNCIAGWRELRKKVSLPRARVFNDIRATQALETVVTFDEVPKRTFKGYPLRFS